MLLSLALLSLDVIGTTLHSFTAKLWAVRSILQDQLRRLSLVDVVLGSYGILAVLVLVLMFVLLLLLRSFVFVLFALQVELGQEPHRVKEQE